LFTYQPVNCMGACALAPVMMIDDQYFDKVKLGHVPDILCVWSSPRHMNGDR
jgi:NADH:ubiquinone oxidoreductase subunit E